MGTVHESLFVLGPKWTYIQCPTGKHPSVWVRGDKGLCDCPPPDGHVTLTVTAVDADRGAITVSATDED